MSGQRWKSIASFPSWRGTGWPSYSLATTRGKSLEWLIELLSFAASVSLLSLSALRLIVRPCYLLLLTQPENTGHLNLHLAHWPDPLRRRWFRRLAIRGAWSNASCVSRNWVSSWPYSSSARP